MPEYELLETQMNVANSAVSEDYLRHHDDAQTMYYAMAARANFKATPAVKVSISVSPGSSTPNYVFPQASTASDGNDVLTFIPVRLATGKTPGTTYTYSATHLDDGSSINLIDATFAKKHQFHVRKRRAVQVLGVNGSAQIHEEVLVSVTFIGRSVVPNAAESILKSTTVLIPYAINPVPMHIPLLSGGHTMAWLRVLTCTNKGLVAATTSTLIGRPDWPYQLRVRNLTHVDAIAISTPQYVSGLTFPRV
jgi:hypothetical protein